MRMVKMQQRELTLDEVVKRLIHKQDILFRLI